jgi:soluble lytic murein transglycosylase-like protein
VLRRYLLVALVAAATSVPCLAAEVLLATGKVLEVTSVRPDGEDIWLDLAEGGLLAVPRELVVEIRYPAPAPIAPTATPPSGEEPPSSSLSQLPSSSSSSASAEGGLAGVIEAAAAKHGLDPRLLRAVIEAESAWDAGAVSPRGAMGLMQLMPATARARGVEDPFDPAQNVDAGAAELAAWIDGYAGEVAVALAAYNAGGRAVDRYDGIPPYTETLTFVRRVLNLYFAQRSEPPLQTPSSSE